MITYGIDDDDRFYIALFSALEQPNQVLSHVILNVLLFSVALRPAQKP